LQVSFRVWERPIVCLHARAVLDALFGAILLRKNATTVTTALEHRANILLPFTGHVDTRPAHAIVLPLSLTDVAVVCLKRAQARAQARIPFASILITIAQNKNAEPMRQWHDAIFGTLPEARLPFPHVLIAIYKYATTLSLWKGVQPLTYVM
jgi:hypothetical protein